MGRAARTAVGALPVPSQPGGTNKIGKRLDPCSARSSTRSVSPPAAVPLPNLTRVASVGDAARVSYGGRGRRVGSGRGRGERG